MRIAPRVSFGLCCGLLALAGCLDSAPTAARRPGCRVDGDCPAATLPLAARCVDGACTTVDLCAEGTCTSPDCRCPCADDAQCPAGAVCESGAGCEGPKTCVPGCHTGEQCAPGFLCALPDCKTCPCPGVCAESDAGCTSNGECPAGEVCGEGTKCERACVPGCRDASECAPGEVCARRNCRACGCGTPICQPAPTCSEDTDCPQGTVCGFDLQCNRRCVPGCVTNDDCAPGESCEPQACDNCTCSRSKCQPIAACTQDTDCGPGTVCEAAPSCTSPKRCMPGCHNSDQCGFGETCEVPRCRDCPCTGTCSSDVQPCTADGDCPAGAVCEPGPGCIGDLRCVPGCHANLQCAQTERCNTQVVCVTCPCPGTCEPDPCHDHDGDGFTSECRDAPPTCAGLRECDCDDDDPAVYPGAPEVCGNVRDDNCDGTRDEGCGCPGGLGACRDDLDCTLGTTYCSAGCCTVCPIGTPMCGMQCPLPPKADLHACSGVSSCGACCTCPTVDDPVCGADYASYGNDCEASCAGTSVLHRGACLRGEGLACDVAGTGTCLQGQYCRDPCPACDGFYPWRCTEAGVCTFAGDCPAGLTPPPCPRGPGSWACTGGLCAFSCP